jgi:hypothetical protein
MDETKIAEVEIEDTSYTGSIDKPFDPKNPYECRQGVKETFLIQCLAGGGAIPLRTIAAMMDKRYVAVPAGVVRSALRVMKRLHVTQYGPEQVDFLRYRPVLSNRKLREEFGYTPRLNSEEIFRFFLEARRGAS